MAASFILAPRVNNALLDGLTPPLAVARLHTVEKKSRISERSIQSTFMTDRSASHSSGVRILPGNYQALSGGLADGVAREDVKVENVTLGDVLIGFLHSSLRRGSAGTD